MRQLFSQENQHGSCIIYRQILSLYTGIHRCHVHMLPVRFCLYTQESITATCICCQSDSVFIHRNPSLPRAYADSQILSLYTGIHHCHVDMLPVRFCLYTQESITATCICCQSDSVFIHRNPSLPRAYAASQILSLYTGIHHCHVHMLPVRFCLYTQESITATCICCQSATRNLECKSVKSTTVPFLWS